VAGFDYLSAMSVPLSINEMTLPEKLQAMEALWEDLSRSAGAFESPAWHGDVLKERLQVAESGQAQFTDWSQAKAGIRQRVP
jgi:hypothetical protein